MPDWKKIKAEYIRSGTSYRKLATKHGVSFSTLQRRATKEKWTDLRRQTDVKSDTKIVEKVASKEAEKVDTILTITDKLLEKINEGITNGTFTSDPQSIRQIMLALKDVREIKGMKSELDAQEQMARIEKLRREAQAEDADKDIHIVIESGLDAYSI